MINIKNKDITFNKDDDQLFVDHLIEGKYEYEVILIDFGLARTIRDKIDIQSEEISNKGNAYYRAPEFRDMDKRDDKCSVPWDTKCDVWSIIQINYEVFNEKLKIDGKS